MYEYLLDEEKFGGYVVAEFHEKEISVFYDQAARLIGAKPHNMAFAGSATEAYIKALSAIHFERGDVILTTDDDYVSNQIQFISLQKRYGIEVIRIKNLESGDLDISDFQERINQHKVKLVAVTHVSTNSGLVQNVEEIGQICHKERIVFLLDACQSVGQIEVNVNNIKCDFLTATGRKFLRGPRGTGFLFVSDRLLDQGYAPVMIDAHGATWTNPNQYKMVETAKRFETWEMPYAQIVGLAKAIDYANDIGLEKIEYYNMKCMDQLRKNLSAIPGVKLFDGGSRTCSILTFRKDGKSLEQIKKDLERNKVAFSVSNREWGLIDFSKKGVDGVIRLSPHYFNTIEEMDQVSEIIAGI